MKKKYFFLIWGFIAALLVILLYVLIQIRKPLFILIPIAGAVCLYFILRKLLMKDYQDERQIQIDMKSSSATMKVGAAVLTLGNIALIIYAFGIPHMIMPWGPMAPPDHIQTPIVGNIAMIELLLLVAMFFVYAGFYAYYEHKYGGDIKDEE